MGKIKYRFGYGFANGIDSYEQRALKMFGEMARQGDQLEKKYPFSWKFRLTKPEEYIFSADYSWFARTSESEFVEYRDIFASAGWDYVCSDYDGHHIFRAPIGTKPIYTDKATLSAKYKRRFFANIICAVGFSVGYIGVLYFYYGSFAEMFASWVFWVFYIFCLIPSFRCIRSNICMARRLKEK